MQAPRRIKIHRETLGTLRDRGGTWGVYENQNFDSASFGHLKMLRVGPGFTYAEAPTRLPDTETAINHGYVLVTVVRAEDLPDHGELEVLQ